MGAASYRQAMKFMGKYRLGVPTQLPFVAAIFCPSHNNLLTYTKATAQKEICT